MLARRRVLVLNKCWSPVGVVSIKDAVNLLFGTYAPTKEHPLGQPKALIVHPESFATFTWNDWSALKPEDGEDYIASAHDYFKIPEVIVLSRYDKLPTHRVTFSRRTIYKRDGYTCQYCGCNPGTEELTIDHVLPKSRGGPTTWTNCVLACLPCNSKKANKTPEECGMKLKREPYKPKYRLFKGDIPCNSWKHFISEAYWEVPLENDEAEDDEHKDKTKRSGPRILSKKKKKKKK